MGAMQILCGIVLYNPQIDRLLNEIHSVVDQVDEICLFDNGSSNIDEVETKVKENFSIDKITLLKSQKNVGIGAALNRIFEYADKNAYKFVLTLDHDSICPSDLVAEYKKLGFSQNTGMLCPNVIDRSMAKYDYFKKTEKPYEYINRTIQSGALVSVECWKKVSGFDEIMFIDFVDFEFCERLKINGYKIVKVNSIKLDHELGKKVRTWYAPIFDTLYKKTGNRFFLYLTYKNIFSNDRCYYSARNNVIFIRRYKGYLNTKKEIFDCFDRIFRKVLRSQNRGKVFFYSIKGLIDGSVYSENM